MDGVEKKYFIYGGLGLLLAVIVMMTLRGGSNAQPGTVSAPSSSELNFLLKNTEDANAQALAQSQLAATSILGYQTAKNNLELGLQQLQAEVSINKTNADSATQIATIQAGAQTQVAQLAQAAATQIADSQRMAAEWASYYAAQGQIQSSNAQAGASETNSWVSGITNLLAGLGL